MTPYLVALVYLAGTVVTFAVLSDAVPSGPRAAQGLLVVLLLSLAWWAYWPLELLARWWGP